MTFACKFKKRNIKRLKNTQLFFLASFVQVVVGRSLDSSLLTSWITPLLSVYLYELPYFVPNHYHHKSSVNLVRSGSRDKRRNLTFLARLSAAAAAAAPGSGSLTGLERPGPVEPGEEEEESTVCPPECADDVEQIPPISCTQEFCLSQQYWIM